MVTESFIHFGIYLFNKAKYFPRPHFSVHGMDQSRAAQLTESIEMENFRLSINFARQCDSLLGKCVCGVCLGSTSPSESSPLHRR